MLTNSEVGVIIAHENPIYRSGLANTINSKDGFAVLYEAADGRQLIDSCFLFKPHLIITSIELPEVSGLEAVETIRKKNSAIKTVLLSGYESDEKLFLEIISALGGGYIDKDNFDTPGSVPILNREGHYYNRLLSDINSAAGKQEVEDGNITQDNDDSNSVDTGGLTGKEITVLQLFGQGLTRDDVKEKLQISINTVDFHKKNIMRKLGLKNLYQLTLYGAKLNNKKQ